MKDVTLKPCPFCGGPAEHDSSHYIGQISKTGLLLCGHAIYCADTGCVGCPVHSVVWTEEDGGFEAAAEAWNTRQAEADKAELVHIAQDLIQHIDWLTAGLPAMLENAALTDEEGLIGAAVDAANSARALLAKHRGRDAGTDNAG